MASPSPPADAFASTVVPCGLALGMLDTQTEAAPPHNLGAAHPCRSPTSSAAGCIASQALVHGARQVPRRLWQPDKEAEECSLLACGKTFGYWTRERKHHCRQCGRVVCAACSGRMKVLLPPKGERGPPKSVRVCDACFGRQDTFTIPRSCSARTSGFDAFGDPETVPPAREIASPSAVPRRMGQLKSSSSSPAVMQLLFKGESSPVQDQSREKSGDLTKQSLACETDAARANSPTLASRADTQTPGSPNSDTKSSKTTSPVRVPRSNNPAPQDEEVVADEDNSAAEQLLEDVAPADERRREWIANVQKKFGADPHYHAMLKYEPQALKALITFTMAVPKVET